MSSATNPFRRAVIMMLLLAIPGCGNAQPSAASAVLVVDRTIPLKGVSGRIDHLAVDLRHHRIFVAELGNGSVDIVDLDGGTSQRISGLDEPQGLGYLPDRNELVVANGGDGTVRFFDATSRALLGKVQLGSDADDVHVDPGSGLVAVGYGSGAIAFIDPVSLSVVKTVAVQGHPEGFALDAPDKRVFVNVPNAHEIVEGGWTDGKIIARWNTTHRANFPMAIDSANKTIAVVYRWPARLALIDMTGGAVRQDLPACSDADDVFFDGKRQRIYVVCGGGEVEVFGKQQSDFELMGGAKTRDGARTGLFVPEFDRLFVAGRAADGTGASLFIFRPQ